MRTRVITLISSLLILYLSSAALAVACTVKSPSDSGPDTLREMLKLKNGCTNITFDAASFTKTPEIILNSPITFEVSNATLSGWSILEQKKSSMIAIKGSPNLSPTSPLINITGQNNIITGLKFNHPDGIGIKIRGSGNTIKFNLFADTATAIQVYLGKNNTIMMNIFWGTAGGEIKFKMNGNNNFQPPSELDAIMIDDEAWVLFGKVSDGTTLIETYLIDEIEGESVKFPVGLTKEVYDKQKLLEGIPSDIVGEDYIVPLIGEGTFFMWVVPSYSEFQLLPSWSYSFLATDSKGNTSTFSGVVKPVELTSFFEAYYACSNAAWFLDEEKGGWSYDYDGDGISNGTEDVNHNCGVDENETDPENPDSDGDGYCDGWYSWWGGGGFACIPRDNCPLMANEDQADKDNDGVGDVCGIDADSDGVLNIYDNCPLVANPGQEDLNGDEQGDACDPDIDGDGILDDIDNCKYTANANQENIDGDVPGDACDDGDGDGLVDATDNCPLISNGDQTDTDVDGYGNECDDDDDGDSILDADDNCPLVANTDQTDADNDKIGAACDEDDATTTAPAENPPPETEEEATGGCSLLL